MSSAKRFTPSEMKEMIAKFDLVARLLLSFNRDEMESALLIAMSAMAQWEKMTMLEYWLSIHDDLVEAELIINRSRERASEAGMN